MLNKSLEENNEYPIILLNLSREGLVLYLIGLFKKDENSVGNFIINVYEDSDKIKITNENQAKIVYGMKKYKIGSPTYELIEIQIPENYMFR